MDEPKKPGKGKRIVGVTFFVLGILTLTFGVTFLILDLLKKPIIRDGDFLVDIGTWQLKDSPEVVWNFTEIGKGTLTTNAHLNDYDFRWRMDDDVLKIETDWLYTLNDDYTFELNQDEKILTLTSEEETYTFVPVVQTEDEESEAENTEESPEESIEEAN